MTVGRDTLRENVEVAAAIVSPSDNGTARAVREDAGGELLASGRAEDNIPLFGFCLIGSFYCALRYPRYSLPLLFLAASYFLIFINIVFYVRFWFVLPMGIIMAFFGGKLLADLWYTGPWMRLTRAAISLAFAYAAAFPMQLDILYLKESRYAAEQWMQEHFRQGAIVETFAPYVLHKYYPRFPSWVKVQSSKLESGTQWEPQALNRVRLPNLYTGREAPDYIVLSGKWYERYLKARAADTDQARVLRELFQGSTGYTLAAAFKTPTVVPIWTLPINPRILIFERAYPDVVAQENLRGIEDAHRRWQHSNW